MNPTDLLLRWPAPAADWNGAAPVGNGRLGAMVFGGTHRARIQINDSTVWSGTPGGPAKALAGVVVAGVGPRRLEEVRDALRAGEPHRAEELLMAFEGPYSQEYLPWADLWLTVPGARDATYRGRTLNLDSGIAEDAFDLPSGASVTRRTWADASTGTLCTDLVAAGGTVDLRLEVTTPLREVHRAAGPEGVVIGIEIPVDGAPAHEPDVPEPLRYGDGPADGYDPFGALALRVATDGEVTADGGVLRVTGATRLLAAVASSTEALRHWRGLDAPAGRAAHLEAAADSAARAVERGTDVLLKAHETELRALLGGTSLRIGPRRPGIHDVARDILSGEDELLTATVLFQLGRYLLAAASRPHAGPPANLQGIWNADLRPAWSSNYTININTQMNYWGAEAAGLGPCHEPLFDLLDRVAAHGRDVARQLYGARGWVAHHNTDMWGWALPVGMGRGAASWAIWQMGGAWLVQHLWDHWEFSQDTAFLRERAWPLLSGCAEFLLDWLVDDGTGRLGTLPSTSPENHYLTPDGSMASLTRSSTMDTALTRAVLERTLRAAAVLGIDTPLGDRISATLPRLHLPRIAAGGWLQEWADDLPEQDPHHRHLSQLVTVHPLGQIDPDGTPALAAAATALLDRRGPGAMGWSWAWKIALRARLRDAATARSLLLEASRPLTGDPDTDAPVDGSEWGGLLPNLFSTHPPFQIDGNYGLMAALTEMVLQSHDGTVHLLPALPAQWHEGEATGLRCRGGLAADFTWHDGALTAVTLRRHAGDDSEPVTVRHGDRTTRVRVATGTSVTLDAHLTPRQEARPC
ncbi:glycosyl hydrolase family 95 catalytic domain-containing protein [Actinacidiphila glaucinigra]|uniref:glycosyl hydrolase family 95 catalytic domain-containing protein n=1 Tax=Actinacidiphila glaucinigra TaxID=235986 RepID=UPI003D901D96